MLMGIDAGGFTDDFTDGAPAEEPERTEYLGVPRKRYDSNDGWQQGGGPYRLSAEEIAIVMQAVAAVLDPEYPYSPSDGTHAYNEFGFQFVPDSSGDESVKYPVCVYSDGSGIRSAGSVDSTDSFGRGEQITTSDFEATGEAAGRLRTILFRSSSYTGVPFGSFGTTTVSEWDPSFPTKVKSVSRTRPAPVGVGPVMYGLLMRVEGLAKRSSQYNTDSVIMTRAPITSDLGPFDYRSGEDWFDGYQTACTEARLKRPVYEFATDMWAALTAGNPKLDRRWIDGLLGAVTGREFHVAYNGYRGRPATGSSKYSTHQYRVNTEYGEWEQTEIGGETVWRLVATHEFEEYEYERDYESTPGHYGSDATVSYPCKVTHFYRTDRWDPSTEWSVCEEYEEDGVVNGYVSGGYPYVTQTLRHVSPFVTITSAMFLCHVGATYTDGMEYEHTDTVVPVPASVSSVPEPAGEIGNKWTFTVSSSAINGKSLVEKVGKKHKGIRLSYVRVESIVSTDIGYTVSVG